MSLDLDVLPAVVDTLQALVDTEDAKLLKGVTLGSVDAVPSSPWAMVQLSTFNVPNLEGSEREVTDWVVVTRLVVQYAPDHYVAEKVLASLVETIRDGFRAHIKMGRANIERTKVSGGATGYVLINDVWYRYIDLNVAVREKVTVRYAA